MAPVVAFLLICALSAGLQSTTAAGSRKLQQSNGPANTYGNAASATTADLVNDPAGRAHLLARLGNPVAYTGSYPLYVGPGQYNVDPTVDPAVVSPINGGPPAAQAGSWQVVGNSGAVALQALPFTNDLVLFLARPLNENGGGDASLTNLLTVDGGTQSNNINLNGDFLQSGAQAIRIVDPTTLNYTLIGQLDRTRVGVTLTTLGDGDIMGALYFNADGALNDNSIGDLPNLPVPISYPQYGGFTLLPLEGPNYTQQVLFVGGAGEACSGSSTPASNTSYLIDVTPGADHSLVTEHMAFPRVMGDLTLLPDGTAFLCNGAQIGIAGGAGPNHSLANSGITVAEIYNVSKPVGQRWSTVADSQIERLCHSVAFLTPNATVLVSGSETTGEHRVQIWTPGYLQDGSPRPVITSAPSVITYSQNFTIQYSGVPSIDRVVLNRVTGSTDSNHMDQRQVVLTGGSAAGSIAANSPSNSNIAPPGQYMLFILHIRFRKRSPVQSSSAKDQHSYKLSCGGESMTTEGVQNRLLQLQRAVAKASTARLPSEGDFYYYNSFKSFKEPVQECLKSITSILQKLPGASTDLEEAFQDKDDAFECVTALLDDTLEQADAAVETAKKALKQGDIAATGQVDKVSGASTVAGEPAHAKKHTGSPKDARSFFAQQSGGTHRPQDRFQDAVDNSNSPFVHNFEHVCHLAGLDYTLPAQQTVKQSKLDAHAQKLNPGALATPPSPQHPLGPLLADLHYTPDQLQLTPPQAPRELEETPLTFVETLQALQSMVQHLAVAKEVAVDLEHHHYRSFQGFTCLMQLSTRQEDFIVDTLALRANLGAALTPIFADPKIVKVLHGADKDIQWLQRDFGIYMANMFDTGQASRVLDYSGHGLGYLLHHCCQVKTDKKYQLADWRVRPLPEELMLYARMDTHYLLYIYDRLKAELITLGTKVPAAMTVALPLNTPLGALGVTLERSKQLCLQMYEKELFTETSHEHAMGQLVCTPEQLAVFAGLYAWRDRIARAEDESTGYVLSRNLLQKLAMQMPTSASKVKSFCNTRSAPLVLKHSTEVETPSEATDAQQNIKRHKGSDEDAWHNQDFLPLPIGNPFGALLRQKDQDLIQGNHARDSSEATAASCDAPDYEGTGHAEIQPFDYAAARAQAPGLELGLNGAHSGGGRKGRGRGRGGRDSGGRGRGRGGQKEEAKPSPAGAFNPYGVTDEHWLKAGKRSAVNPRSGNRSQTFSGQ
ncbi:hypothetical protein WJX79_009245 [Trebouxia sp. C0005]